MLLLRLFIFTLQFCTSSETFSLLRRPADLKPIQIADWSGNFQQLKLVEDGDGSIHLTHGGSKISFWHDIPLFSRQTAESSPYIRFHFVCEIPANTTAKYEINKEIAYNPIKQDINRDGTPRFLSDDDMLGYNYGAIPQTWESIHENQLFQVPGDNDPIDAIHI